MYIEDCGVGAEPSMQDLARGFQNHDSALTL